MIYYASCRKESKFLSDMILENDTEKKNAESDFPKVWFKERQSIRK